MQFYIDNLALDADLVGFFSWLKHDVIQPVALEAESSLASAQRAKKPRLVLDLWLVYFFLKFFLPTAGKRMSQ